MKFARKKQRTENKAFNVWCREADAIIDSAYRDKPAFPDWDVFGHGPSNWDEYWVACEIEGDMADRLAAEFASWLDDLKPKIDAHLEKFMDVWRMGHIKKKYMIEFDWLLEWDNGLNPRDFSDDAIEAEARISRKKAALADS